MFMMKSEMVSQPSVVSDDLLQSKRQCFTFSKLLCKFQQTSHTVVYEIITVRLGYHKFCAKWVPKMLMGAHKENGFSFEFFTAIPQRW
jgi:hypothetical protein